MPEPRTMYTAPPGLYVDSSQSKLSKLHLQFYLRSAEKLFALLKRADPCWAASEVKKLFENVRAVCHACSTSSSRPFRFGASFPPDEITFDHEVAVDLVWMDGSPVMNYLTGL